MKTGILFIVVALITAGCATSLAPTDNFHDWSNPVAYHHYQPQKVRAVASVDLQTQADKDGAEGE